MNTKLPFVEKFKHKTYIIAEAEINHNGDVATALKMVEVAKEIGADAIKFQYILAGEIATEDSPYYSLFKKVELSQKEFKTLFSHPQNGSVYGSGGEPLGLGRSEAGAQELNGFSPPFRPGSKHRRSG